jgi:hypothetical protein
MRVRKRLEDTVEEEVRKLRAPGGVCLAAQGQSKNVQAAEDEHPDFHDSDPHDLQLHTALGGDLALDGVSECFWIRTGRQDHVATARGHQMKSVVTGVEDDCNHGAAPCIG